MSIHLTFSNRTETLFDNFAAELGSQWSDPFDPPPLLVPNAHTAKWLKLRLTEREGAVANLDVTHVESFLWDQLCAQASRHEITGHTLALLDIGTLEQFLFRVIGDRELLDSTPGLAQLRDYINPSDTESHAVRKVRICCRLARLFLEYEYNRPGWSHEPGLLDCWPHKDYFSSKRPGSSTMERWQRELYGLVLGGDGFRDRYAEQTGTLYCSLPHLREHLRNAGVVPFDTSTGPPKVFCFAVASLSIFHRQMLQEFAGTTDIFVYLLNPCAAFWEDVATTRSRVAAHKPATLTQSHRKALPVTGEEFEQGELFGDHDENGLLQAWGHVGKENIKLWCGSTDYDFDFHEVHSSAGDSPTVLHTVQDMILSRAAEAPERLSQDPSIQIVEAPAMVREIENLRNSILWNMEQDPSLALSDILVLAPDIDKYRATIHQVFGPYGRDEEGYIPYAIADESPGSSLFARALEQMFDLAVGRFSRTDLFAFLRNPLVMHSLGIDRSTLEAWERWTERLNVYHGFDRHHRSRLEHEPLELHTWRHGIQRLLAGRICDSVVFLSRSEDAPEEAVAPYRDTAAEDDTVLEQFCATVEGLFADLEKLNEGPWDTPAETATFLGEMIGAWIRVPLGEMPEEQSVRNAYLRRLERLSIHHDIGTPPQSPQDFAALARTLLAVELPGNGGYLTGGLTISSLRPACPVPARITYVVGLGAGEFPGRDTRDTIDLRTTRRMIGDLSTPQLNRFTFLETLVCTRDKLYLSYVCHDIRKDEVLQPCGTIVELESFVAQSVLPPDTPFRHVRVPLRPEDSRLFASGRTDGTDPLVSLDPHTLMLKTVLETDRSECLTDVDQQLSDTDDTAAETVYETSIPHVCEFLRNPVEYRLKRGLGLWNESDEDTTVSSDEPLESVELAGWSLREEFMSRWVRLVFGDREAVVDDTPVDTARARRLFDHLYTQRIVRGETPEGHLADLDRDRLYEGLEGFVGAVAALRGDLHGYRYYPALPVGADPDNDTGQYRPSVIELESGKQVLITGEAWTLFTPPDRGAAAVLLEVTASKTGVRHFLSPYLFALFHAATAPRNPMFDTVKIAIFDTNTRPAAARGKEVVEGATKYAGLSVKSMVLTEETASTNTPFGAYVRTLLGDMLQGNDYDHLPIEAVEKLGERLGEDDGGESQQLIQGWLEEDAARQFPAYRPRLQALELTELRVPAQAGEIYRTRLKPIFTGRFDD